MFVLQVLATVIFVYGLLSLIQDILNEITYKKVFHKMKIVVFAKDLEESIEQYVIELWNMKKVNPFKQITVIDLNEKDSIEKIKTRLENSEINVQILSKKEGKELIDNIDRICYY